MAMLESDKETYEEYVVEAQSPVPMYKNETLNERQKNYGDWEDFAVAYDVLRGAAKMVSKGRVIPAPLQVALDMILFKTARILTGNPSYQDNWHDIAGYAQLAEEELKRANNGGG